MRRKQMRVILLSAFIFIIFGYLGWWWQANVRDGRYKDLIPALYIIGFVKINYYQPVNFNRLLNIYLKTGDITRTLKSLNDPYTEFLSQEDFVELRKETNGYFDGIGIYLQKDEPIIWKVANGTPSEKAGLRAGDRIIRVDRVPVKSAREIVQKIRGKAGSIVVLQVVRNEQGQSKTVDIAVVRAKIYIPTVQMNIENDPIIGKYALIKIDQFSDTTAHDLGKSLKKIDKIADCRGLIIDLRANPGGLLEAAVDVTGHFLPKGTPVIYIYKRGQLIRVARVNKATVHKDLPVVMLIDNWSASAAEIVAGALKDQNRAILVGTATFGKDLIQEIKELPTGTGFKITVYNYLTSGGKNIHKRGVQPDLQVGKPLDEILKRGDTDELLRIHKLQEQAAMKVLRQQVLKRDNGIAKLAG